MTRAARTRLASMLPRPLTPALVGQSTACMANAQAHTGHAGRSSSAGLRYPGRRSAFCDLRFDVMPGPGSCRRGRPAGRHPRPPNPITGERVEGNLVDMELGSFVGVLDRTMLRPVALGIHL